MGDAGTAGNDAGESEKHQTAMQCDVMRCDVMWADGRPSEGRRLAKLSQLLSCS